MTSIELLAPARDLATALEAIRHGADAVYIGAPQFGARAAAGNSLDDIRELCRQARPYAVRIYVTLNTILFDNELEEARQLTWDLYNAGVDALIVQDTALLEMDIAPIALHASTQMDNRNAEKVRWLGTLGFEQAVLARELTLTEIAAIHRDVPEVALEAFVHGSICVSYNGQCYASQYCFGRSANRGECAQFCRMPFDLVDRDGNLLESQRHLLSLRDMNRSNELEEMLDAGIVSLKIEGRLKDPGYVKNVVAYYRQRLDEIFLRRPEYERSSMGRETIAFEPRLEASFNRGFTNYFLHGRTRDLCNPVTPKSMGEHVGMVKEIRHNCIIVAGIKPFSNGDGLCFVDAEGRLQGFRVNRAENNKVFPQQMPRGLKPHTRLYRNQDHQFETILARPSAERKIGLDWTLSETSEGFRLTASLPDGRQESREFPLSHELARHPQQDQIEQQLSRLGNTPYECANVVIEMSDNWFIPGSTLADWRRTLVAAITPSPEPQRHYSQAKPGIAPFRHAHITYEGNVANAKARKFYLDAGAALVDQAMEAEASPTVQSPRLMTCRYCIRYQLGHCTKEERNQDPSNKSQKRWQEPLYLKLADGRRFRLKFDCKNCQMEVYAE